MSRRVTAYVVDQSPKMLEDPGSPAWGRTYMDWVKRYVLDQVSNRYLWQRKTDVVGVYCGDRRILGFNLPTEVDMIDCEANLNTSDDSDDADVYTAVKTAAEDMAASYKTAAWHRQILVIGAEISVDDESMQGFKAFCQDHDIAVQWAWVGGPVPSVVSEWFPDDAGQFEEPASTIGQTRIRDVAPTRGGMGMIIMRASSDSEAPNLLQIPCELFPAVRKSDVPHASLIAEIQVDNEERQFHLTTAVHQPTYTDDDGAKKPADPSLVVNGYLYGSEVLVATPELQQLINQQMPEPDHLPAEAGGLRCEIVAVMPPIEPWVPMGFSDFLVPAKGDDSATIQLEALAHSLRNQNLVALARYRSARARAIGTGEARESRVPDAEMCVLEPYFDSYGGEEDPHPRLLRTRLPFREEFRDWYRFGSLSTDQDGSDAPMDRLVDSMMFPKHSEQSELEYLNPALDNTARYIKTRILPTDENFVVPGFKPWHPDDASEPSQEAIAELQSQFNIHEEVPTVKTDESHIGIDEPLDLDAILV